MLGRVRPRRLQPVAQIDGAAQHDRREGPGVGPLLDRHRDRGEAGGAAGETVGDRLGDPPGRAVPTGDDDEDAWRPGGHDRLSRCTGDSVSGSAERTWTVITPGTVVTRRC